jgi:RND family efflux transporter MFP subunit
MTTRQRKALIYVPLIAIVVIGSVLGSLTLRARSVVPDDTPEPLADAALTVTLTQPKPMQWPELIRANGDIAAWQEAVVSAEVAGLKLAEVLVDVGDQVKKGQVLARFDAATQRASVAQSQAAVAEAQALLTEAQSNADRALRLRDSAAISEQDLIQASTRAHAAQAQLESAKARQHAAELLLQYTEVVAPDDGVISSRTAMLGIVTNPGAELFRLVRQNRLEWRAELTGAQLAHVRVGLSATIVLPDGSTVTGSVRQLSPVLSAATRTGIAYVELDDDGAGKARAGMYAAGTIEVGETDGIELPSSAVIQRDGHDYVFVMVDRSQVQLTKVDVGRRRGGAVEIVSGVAPTDNVVASGGAFLNDGDRVRVVEESRSS